MARPRKAPDARQNVTLRIYVTAAEADALYVAALRARRDLSEFARELLMGFIGQETKTTTARHGRALP